jgi:hypothetical protein
MDSRKHSLGFKLLVHLVTGVWFAASSFVWLCIFSPWSQNQFKGRGIDMPWIVPRVIWQSANQIFRDVSLAYLPLVLASGVFGALLVARTLYRRPLSASLVALTFGGLAALPTFATLVVVGAFIGEMQRPNPEIRGIVFLVILGGLWGLWCLPTLMLTYAISGWLLYRAKLIVERLQSKFAESGA